MSKDSNQQPSTSYQQSVDPRVAENGTLPRSAYPQYPTNDMATLSPPPAPHAHPDPYQPHPGYAMYPPASYPPSHPPPPNQSQPPASYVQQPAPRQRTAIACRYCRRRKIRCHGFDSSPDGRCTNCLRFHQECIFTPVSAQAHAFVPAHTAYPYMRGGRVQTGPDGRPLSYPGQPGPPLYSAHGQPLGPMGHHDPAYPPPPQAGWPPAPYPPQTLPGPPPPLQYEERPPQGQDHRASLNGPRRSSGGYEYPDTAHMSPTTPTSSTAYQAGSFPPSSGQPYYNGAPGDRRTSPTSSYFGPRPTGSPHASHAHGNVLPLPAGLHPPQVLPSIHNQGTSPTTSAPSRPGGLSVADMLTTTSGTRSETDNNMLNALNRSRR